MRTTLGLSILGIFLVSAAASAEPARTLCYEGDQVVHIGKTEQKNHAVLERVYDPAKNEIRERTWSDANPTKEAAITSHVDPKAGTFEFDDPDVGEKGTGKLDGKPWHWTTLTMKLTMGDIVIESTSKMTDTKVHFEATTTTNKGQQLATLTGEMTAFDCKKLDTRKAALAKPATR